MAISTDYSFQVEVSESGVALAKFLKSLSESAAWTELTRDRLAVADGVSDQALNLGGCASADILCIMTDQEISIKLDGSGDAITIASVFISSGGHTAVTISNASGSVAIVDILVLD